MVKTKLQVRDLAAGYHVLRAFVLDRDGLCIKHKAAYIEAEFFAVSARPIGDKYDNAWQKSVTPLLSRACAEDSCLGSHRFATSVLDNLFVYHNQLCCLTCL